MSENLEAVLIELAKKFGTTAEHLWAVMVKQAYISAASELLFFILFGGVLLFGAVKIWGAIQAYEEGYYKREAKEMFWIIGGFVGGGFLLVFYCFISSAIQRVANPEFWALQQIIK
jgi:uncharacterized BrkB/YihY/UPF0761 family membrane protein